MTQEHVEIVTHALTQDVELPNGLGTLALITLDNGLDHTKPTTLGVSGLANIRAALEAVKQRVDRGEVQAVAVTGKPYYLAAGADLKGVQSVGTASAAKQLGMNGHGAYRILTELKVPTFAFINGVALGGGLEIALSCAYRTMSSDVGAIGLPETSLGLIPGWGGTYLLPRLIGIEAAVQVILSRAAANKPFKAPEALELGMVDLVLEPADFLEQSIIWAASVISGEQIVPRREPESKETWAGVLAAARAQVDATVHGSRPAPYRALDLLDLGPDTSLDEAYAAEDEALAELIMSEEFRASIYAFHTVNGAKRPAHAPDPKLAQPVTHVGIVGAGLMAAQIALIFAQRLQVPVTMRDLDQERVDKGLGYVRSTIEKLVSTGRMTPRAAANIDSLIKGTTEIQDFAGCDFVIEAVTEVMDLKKKVFAQLEDIISPTAILATNTSALSISQMSRDLANPERVVGLHFFNPVAQMPLVEVIHAEHTSDQALATGFAVVKKLRKTGVKVLDRPGFVVNRLLVLLMGKIVEVVEQGTDITVADRALRPLGLPMGPFALFDLVGPAVGHHVLTSLRADLGDRFPLSPGLQRIVTEKIPVVLPAARGTSAQVDPALQEVFAPVSPTGLTEDEVLSTVLEALTQEIGLMLEEGVVESVTQIDLCMILGAGWSFAAGGIAPYLDRNGFSEKVLGRRLLPGGVASVPLL